MGKLSDILKNGQAESLKSAWDSTEAADEFAPIPAGEYVAHIMSGELFNAKTGTAGYKIVFRIAEGEHIGRQVWHDLWLTDAAIGMTKRDLGKLGITSIDQLEQPIPRGIRCSVKVALRKSDSGDEFNAVKSFSVIGIDPPEQDVFAPTDDGSPAPPPAASADGAEGDDPGAKPTSAADAF